MFYTELGHTGLKLSNLGFGASSLGSVFHATREDESIRAVETAIEGGINFIDVSPYYGYYKAETVLGKALRGIPRDKYYLSTKVGRYGEDGHNTWDYSGERARKSVYESMERLGVDHIDIINVHDIEFQASLPGGLQKVVDETLPALVRLREEGVVGHVGITDLQLDNLRWVVEHCEEGTVESILNFCHYCLCDDALADHFDFFESHGIGIINASPLSMGLLSRRGAPDWHPAPLPLAEACQRAAQHMNGKLWTNADGTTEEYTIERLAMQYSCQNPRIASTLFSSANPDNVARNIQWANEAAEEATLQEVLDIIGPAKRLTWCNT